MTSASRVRLGVLYAATAFISAALIFFVQPMFAKMLLPSLGGAPAVWTTAMLFFQSVLLAGYAYAHFLTTRLSIRQQIVTHACVAVIGALALPIAAPAGWTPDPTHSLVPQALLAFAIGVGAPFFFLSANAPLLQAWYARCGGGAKLDPFYLYAASNAGSLLALLAFPLLAEPFFGARAISDAWMAVYFALLAGLAACALRVLAAARRSERDAHAGPAREQLVRYRADVGTVARWIALAFVPSSLMLGVTSVAAGDLGSFPLIWVIPLALYLVTFVIAFSESVRLRRRHLELAVLLSLSTTIGLFATNLLPHFGIWAFALLFVTFFLVALLYHTELYSRRPPVEGLTVFYFAMAVGGVLGGVFNSIVAPLLFDTVLETPLVLAVAGIVLSGVRSSRRDILAAALFAGAIYAFCLAIQAFGPDSGLERRLAPVVAAIIGLSLLASGLRPYRYVGIAALSLLIGNATYGDKNLVYADRSFFGSYAVKDKTAFGMRVLSHGTTLHGAQFVEDLGSRPRILSYYHPEAPLGRLFRTYVAGTEAHVGVVGLGVGALSCYSEAGQVWRFYEIDPVVDEIARRPDLFSYMDECGGDAPTVFGDARISLAQESGPKFDVLVIDAYSSDAVPVHLLTMEALELYKSRLAPDGVLALHISNRYYILAPVVARAANALGLQAMFAPRKAPSELDATGGEAPSEVVVLSASPETLSALPDSGWRLLQADETPPWSDDNASLLTALKPLW